MPRTYGQAFGFLFGLWLALWLAPLRVASVEADPAFATLEGHLHERVNRERVQRHRIPLRRLPQLDAVARLHSRDMVRRGYVAHLNPEGDNALNRLQRAGVEGFSLAAENIGKTDRGDPNDEIVRAWLASVSHRENLLSPPFNATGIGIARAADGSLIYTQVFVSYPR